MYILNHVNLEKDESISSEPVCLKSESSGEINCMGILVKREMANEEFEGTEYYQFVYFYGKSPVNFNKRDYEKLAREYSFDLDLEMISDFRYCFSEFSSFPGLGTSQNKKITNDNEIQLMQVSQNNRFR